MLASKTKDFFVFLTLNVALALPALIAVWMIRTPQKIVIGPGTSPFGYTISLALFVVPCAIFGTWTLWTVHSRLRRRAFALTIALLCPLGFLLDLLFGRLFLTFPNQDAVLARRWPWALIPAYDGHGPTTAWIAGLLNPVNWHRFIPIEEFIFYSLGFVAMLLIYVWGDAILFKRHKVDPWQSIPKLFQGWRSSAASWLVIGALLFSIAFAIRKSQPPENAFPGYFLFLLLVAILPSMVCFHVSYHFINWRALTVGWLFILAISQFWEGTLGVPYEWWGYNPNQMMGIFIKPQCLLPIEAVLVWSLGSWTTVVLYEFILAILQLKKGPGLEKRKVSSLYRKDSTAHSLHRLKDEYALRQPPDFPDRQIECGEITRP